MKKLGLIGGVGPESTIEYYRLIIKRYRERMNTKEYPEIIIHCINMTEMLDCIMKGEIDRLTGFLADRIKILEAAGAGFGAIASNTPHIVFESLAEKVKIPLISIVEETAKNIQKEKIKRTGLFGTKFTMVSGFYKRIAEKYSIEIITPGIEDQDYIHEKYMSELVFNKILPDTKRELQRIAEELIKKESIEGIILGGTELPLILNQSDFNNIVIFDTTKIHVESIVAKMIES